MNVEAAAAGGRSRKKALRALVTSDILLGPLAAGRPVSDGGIARQVYYVSIGKNGVHRDAELIFFGLAARASFALGWL